MSASTRWSMNITASPMRGGPSAVAVAPPAAGPSGTAATIAGWEWTICTNAVSLPSGSVPSFGASLKRRTPFGSIPVRPWRCSTSGRNSGICPAVQRGSASLSTACE